MPARSTPPPPACSRIAFGEATKTVPFVADARKAYRFTVRWGAATDDRRRRGRRPRHLRRRAPTPAAIRAALPAFTGDILQVPPQVSAVKVEGERAYALRPRRRGARPRRRARSTSSGWSSSTSPTATPPSWR